MASGGPSVPDRSGKMHSLFRELYLDGDPDDSDEAEREWRSERARSRARRRMLQQRRGTRRL